MGIVFLNTKEYGPSSGEGKSQQNERPKLNREKLDTICDFIKFSSYPEPKSH